MASEADLKLEIAISRMLRAGVSLAAVVIFSGAVLYLRQAHGVMPDYRHFHGVASKAVDVASMFEGVRALDSRSVIRLGILLLIATPVLRVAYCVFGFAAQKDRLYVVISSAVLAVLLYSFLRV